MTGDRQFVIALARGLDILRCFTPERPELGTSDIAEVTGLPQPTVWRLCHTLSKLGYLVPGRNASKLRAGPAVLSLGSASVTHAGIAEVAYPLMKEIADEFQASVSLAGRDRLNMVIVQRAEAHTILKLNLHVGSALAIERSALGWAYIAAVTQEERNQVMTALRRASPGRFEQIRRNVEGALKQYARGGFVFNLRQYHPDVNSIGVPVISADGRRVMALNCGGASSVVTERKLAWPIAGAMKALAKRLGPALAT